MQNYSSFLDYTNKGEAEVVVSSNRCHYRVWVGEEEISISGPGVSETLNPEDFNLNPNDLDREDMALIAVILFENGVL